MKKILILLFVFPTIFFAKNNANYRSKTTEIFSHRKWTSLLQKNVTPEGVVNYKGFKNDAIELNEYLRNLLDNIPSAGWSQNATICYWVNCYNAYTVKLIIDNYGVKSINSIPNPWENSGFILKGKRYSLNFIEHEFLRKYNEPRIHFAICCGSKSCAKLLNKAYKEDTLDEQLTQATKFFINDKSKNLLTPNAIKISKKFEWYLNDFSDYKSVIHFINLYSDVKIKSKAKISYLNYDWSLNN